MPKPLRVLIVDDHEIFAETLKIWLDRDPTLEVVGIAHTGGEAVDLAVRTDAEVVLMDVSLPDIDGFEATRRLHAIRRAAKVIAVTGWSHDDLGAQVEDAGMVSYLSKDLIHDTVRAAITAAVESAGDR